jgi:hypothetical protein
MVRSVIDAPLKDATTMTMGRNFDAVGGYRIIDELDISAS